MHFFRLGSISAAMFAIVLCALPADAVTYKVLYSFKDPAYGDPLGRLFLQISTGSLFGTAGGTGGGHGSVFELTPSGGGWTHKTIFNFDGPDGFEPEAGLSKDSTGAFYGTTRLGGASGNGTVFKLTQSGGGWKETILHSFGNGSDGHLPTCDLVTDLSTGALYGTTQEGGAYGYGTVFELAQSGGKWTETVLWSFEGGGERDGETPYSGLRLDATGALYGTTYIGGDYGRGTVFELTPSGGGWIETVLHDFGSGSDGQNPIAPLIGSSKSGFYGTTFVGGASGQGTVFYLAQSGGVLTYTVLYNFTGGNDGGLANGGLRQDSTGALYGTTARGGAHDDGAVFKLTQSGGVWTETVLHSFRGSDGQNPEGALVEDSAGTLYGTTYQGGAYGYGTVFLVGP